MATEYNLGNVVGLLRGDEPEKTYIIWSKPVDILDPNITIPHYYDGLVGQWVPLSAAKDFFLPPVIDYDQNTPPVSPTLGDTYLLGSTPTGEWSGKAYYQATWYGGVWSYISPRSGAKTSLLGSASTFITYNGSAWVTTDTGSDLGPGTEGQTIQHRSGVWTKSTTITDIVGTISIDYDNRYLKDSSGNNSVYYQNRELIDENAYATLDWNNQRLKSTADELVSIDWYNKVMYDADEINSISWDDRFMRDSTNQDSIDWENRFLYDPSGTTALKWIDRKLFNSDGNVVVYWNSYSMIDSLSTQSVDWDSRILYNSDGFLTVAWNDYQLRDSTDVTTVDWGGKILAATVISIDWDNRIMYDASGVFSLQWENRCLYNDAENIMVYWNDGILNDPNNGEYSIHWINRIAYDHNGSSSIDWDNRILKGYWSSEVDFTIPDTYFLVMYDDLHQRVRLRVDGNGAVVAEAF